MGEGDFYVRYYTGSRGRHGHEFLEFEYSRGVLKYANNSNYRNESLIRRKVNVSPEVAGELERIVRESEITRESDDAWPETSDAGSQELEIVLDDDHVFFELAKVGSLVDIRDSADPEGLRVLYYLVQDLKIFVMSLIALHYKIKPT